jgi:hypothetical protein
MAVIKKLGMGIIAFDATELMELGLNEIRDQVDYIIVSYQKKSYFGNPIDSEDWKEINRLKEIGLIDELVEFQQDFKIPDARQEECRRRNLLIRELRAKGCSHTLITDSDELYSKEMFANAKDIINRRGYSNTYCSYVNYYRDFEHQLLYPFRPGVPFINAAMFEFTYNGPAPLPTDPTRRVLNPMNIGTYVFKDEEILMAHAAWIRKDIRKKLVNWSAKKHFTPELIEKAVKRWNEWKEGDDAVMLFNVPGNAVKVKKLEPPIHNIKVPWL